MAAATTPTTLVLLAKPSPGGTKVDPVFQARGRSDLTKAPVSSVPVVGMPGHRLSNYAVYRYFIAAWMQATITQKSIKAGLGNPIYFKCNLPSDQFLPFPYPPMVASFPKTTSIDQVTALAAECGGRVDKFGGKSTIFVDKGSFAVYQKLVGHVDSELGTRVGGRGGISSLEGIQGFRAALMIVSAFLKTHVYPSIIAPLEDGATPFYAFLSGESTAESWVVDNEEQAKKYFRTAEGDRKDFTVRSKKKGETVPDTMNTHFWDYTKARPSPKDFPFFGGVADVPFLHGIPFPYFNGLLEPDFSVVPSVMANTFLHAMGSDNASALRFLDVLRKGNALWAASYEGQALGHLIMGIKIALDCQARLFPVIESESYLGFVLLGVDYEVRVGDTVFQPQSPENLKLALEKFSDRVQLLDKVKVLVETLPSLDDDEMLPELDLSEIRSPRKIRNYIVNHKAFEEGSETMTDIIRLLRGIHFPEPYWRLSAENIVKALSFLRADEFEMADDVPMFVTDNFFVDKAVWSILPVFGASAPSFLQYSGTAWEIPGPDGNDAASIMVKVGKGEKKKDAMAMSTLYVSVKPLAAAVRDMLSMSTTWRVLQSQERSGASKNIALSGEERNTVWDGLKLLRRAIEVPKAEGSKGKGRDITNNGPLGMNTIPVLGKRNIDDFNF